MKLFKTLLLFALISVITVSCKETKKEKISEETESTELTSESSESETSESTELASESLASETPESNQASETIETSTKEVEVIETGNIIEEILADTPVIYPGCEGTVNEIRACSIKEFKGFFQKNFDSSIANDLYLDSGEHSIRGMLKISETGKVTVLKVEAEKEALEEEFERVMDLYPAMTAATKNGQPISVSFVLPVKFKVM